jgi:hypothetical protein
VLGVVAILHAYFLGVIRVETVEDDDKDAEDEGGYGDGVGSNWDEPSRRETA